MSPELNPTRLTVSPSAHIPNSHIDSPTVTNKSNFLINFSTTDPGTVETRPSEERDDFSHIANERRCYSSGGF